MKNVPVKHHYIPKFYLANFTEAGHKDSKLWVTDQKQCKQWHASPSAVAYKKKLYTVEEGTDAEPDAIEKAFGVFESMAAPVIAEIIKNKRLPGGDGYSILINFIAIMAARTPKMINHRTKAITGISEKILGITLSEKEHWYGLTSEMVDAGKLPPEMLEEENYDKMCEFFQSKKYKLDISQNSKIKLIMESADVFIPVLARRKWSLLVSDDISTKFLGGFISSDNPVTLVSRVKLPPIYAPGFGMPGTEVTMPLSKDVAIVGRFEGKETVKSVLIKDMALINSRTGTFADRFLYHSDKNYIFINNHNDICNVNYLLSQLSNQK